MESYPAGWYGVAFSHELRPGEILTRKSCGIEVIVWRTSEGRAVVSAAHCPHLGAHLGCGGKITGDRIQCPFHKFKFDSLGRCSTPLLDVENRPSEPLMTFPSLEQSGIILAFFGKNQSPIWELPQIDMHGYLKPLYHSYEFRAHPQDIAENSVDLLHFKTVHHYQGATLVHPVETEGPYLKAQYRVLRKGIPLLSSKSLEVSFIAHLHGLGFSFVDIEVPALKVKARSFVWATPTEGENLHLRVGFAMMKIPSLKFLGYILQRILFSGFKNDVSQDVPIFSKKIRVENPPLSHADGPIRLYRSWAQQFY